MTDQHEQDIATAAMVISDLLSSTLMPKDTEWESGRTYIYVWERQGLNWLRDLAKEGRRPPINAWTAKVVSDGYPFNSGEQNGRYWHPDNTETFDNE